EVAVLVHAPAVAGDVPAVGELRAVHRLVVPVGAEHGGPAGTEGEVSLFAGRLHIAAVVDDAGSDAGHRLAHAAGLDRQDGVVGDHDRAGFGLPPVVVEGQADGAFGPDDRFGVERLADGHGVAE